MHNQFMMRTRVTLVLTCYLCWGKYYNILKLSKYRIKCQVSDIAPVQGEQAGINALIDQLQEQYFDGDSCSLLSFQGSSQHFFGFTYSNPKSVDLDVVKSQSKCVIVLGDGLGAKDVLKSHHRSVWLASGRHRPNLNKTEKMILHLQELSSNQVKNMTLALEP